MSKLNSANAGSLRRLVRSLRKELRCIVENYDAHSDVDGNDIAQDYECFCSRCIAVRALRLKPSVPRDSEETRKRL